MYYKDFKYFLVRVYTATKELVQAGHSEILCKSIGIRYRGPSLAEAADVFGYDLPYDSLNLAEFLLIHHRFLSQGLLVLFHNLQSAFLTKGADGGMIPLALSIHLLYRIPDHLQDPALLIRCIGKCSEPILNT